MTTGATGRAERQTDSVVITAIMPLGKTVPLLKRLRAELGIHTGTMSHARGHGVSAAHQTGLPAATEKEILTIVIDSARAEEAFEFVFFEGEVNRPHGGIVYMTEPGHAMPFVIPEGMPEEA